MRYSSFVVTHLVLSAIAVSSSLAQESVPDSGSRQVDSTSNLQWFSGIAVGATQSQFRGNRVPNSSPGLGWVVNSVVVRRRWHSVSVEGDLGFSRRVATAVSPGVESRVTVDYLEVPVLARVGDFDEEGVSPRVGVGFRPSIRTGHCYVRTSLATSVVRAKCGDGSTLSFSASTFSLLATGGIGIPIRGRQLITLDLWVDLGLTRLTADKGPTSRTAYLTLGIERMP